MSIWHGIDRGKFERNLSELERLAPSQEVRVNRKLADKRPDDVKAHARKLPDSVESQIADDLAFLAASESTPGSVSAATIVNNAGSTGLIISLAANEGVLPRVQEALVQLLKYIERCACCEVSRDISQEQCLDTILDLHSNRIFERLGSPKYVRPVKALIKDAVPIAPRLKALHKVATARMNSVQRKARASLLEDVDRLKHAIEEAEGIRSSMQTEVLKAVIKAAYEVTIDGTSLPRRLVSAGYPQEYEQRKEIRQTQALANYWRLSHYLVSVARRHHNLFTSCRLKAVQADSPEFWPKGSSRKHFVHAEIQLLTYHETNTEIPRPAFIGVSKKACFLCNCFITAYPGYSISKTHGEVHSQWTVLDKSHYSKEIRLGLAKAMRATDVAVINALKDARRSKTRRAPQVQSAINSVVGSISTASVLTVQAKQPLEENQSTTSDINYRQVQDDTAVCDGNIVSKSTNGKAVVRVPSSPSIEVDFSSDNSSAGTAIDETSLKRLGVQAGSPVRMRCSWLELLVELETPGAEAGEERSGLKGSCIMITEHGDKSSTTVHQVNTTTLPTIGSATFEVPEGSRNLGVSFTAPGRDPIEAIFCWNTNRE